MKQRATVLLALAAAGMATLSACKDGNNYDLIAGNKASEPIMFRIEFSEGDQAREFVVEPGEAEYFEMESCEQARTVVSTMDGRLRAEIAEPLCSNWDLLVDEDLVLHHYKNPRFQYPHLSGSADRARLRRLKAFHREEGARQPTKWPLCTVKVGL